MKKITILITSAILSFSHVSPFSPECDVRDYVKYGGNVNACDDQEGTTPLMWAAVRGDHDCVITLLKAGAHVDAQDKNGSTALMHVVNLALCENLTVAFAEGFMSGFVKQATIVAPEQKILAVYKKIRDIKEKVRGYEKIIKALIAAKANPLIKDNDGKTALNYAENDPEIKALLEKAL